jgi:hypothetical protein
MGRELRTDPFKPMMEVDRHSNEATVVTVGRQKGQLWKGSVCCSVHTHR